MNRLAASFFGALIGADLAVAATVPAPWAVVAAAGLIPLLHATVRFARADWHKTESRRIDQ
jgi:hypothetical protein